MSNFYFTNTNRNFQRLPENLRGAYWMVLATFLLTVMGVLVKFLGRDLNSFQIVFFRCLMGVVFLLPFVVFVGLKSLGTRRPGLHLLRASVGMFTMFCVFYVFSHMPFAEGIAIIFSRPLFSVILASLLLGEIVDWHRGLAAVIGFLGVIVLVRPGTAAFDPVSLVALSAAVMGSGIAVIIKKLSRTESTSTIVMWFNIGGVILSLVPALYYWIPPTFVQWGILSLIGALGVAGQAALTRAFSTGDTSFVTPFDYMRLVFAALFDIFLFVEVPDIWAIIGALMIVGSGYYIARRELALRSLSDRS